MRRCRLYFFLIYLCAGAGHTVSLSDGVKPQNVTLNPSSHSLEIRWSPPSHNLSSLELYRVRVIASEDEVRKWVHWLPADQTPRELLTCLKPSTQYEVQVMARFRKDSNITDGHSDIVRVSTLPEVEPNLLSRFWEHRLYVLIGAVIMALIFIFFLPCVCFCLARRRRSLIVNREDKKTEKKERGKTLDTTELQDRASVSENRYSMDPVKGVGSRMQSPQACRQPPPTHTPPPTYSQARTPSFPDEQAPERPPMPVPYHPHGSESDPDDDYQNNVFGPGADMELYANQSFTQQAPHQAEFHIYGNVQY